MPKPVVAIVGRPNVGKSTLFNRLVGRMEAIVSDLPGTTRDRVMADAIWEGREFLLVDTGGIEMRSGTPMWEQVRQQAQVAIHEADVIVMVADANEGATAGDLDVADILRKAGRPLLLAANKADNSKRETLSLELFELGMGDPIPISAYHNIGIDDLMTRVVALLPPEKETEEVQADVRLAIVGRTNVGKSQLLNTITGQERAIVSEVAGTTRDTVDTLVSHGDKRLLVIDTAGIRRSGDILPGIEKYSVLRSVRAIDRAEVAVLLMDAVEPATAQDTHIASPILEAYRGIVLAVNKWDLAEERNISKEAVERQVRSRFKFLTYAPVCFVSASKGTGVKELLDTVCEVHSEWTKTVPRYTLRRKVLEAVAESPPATSGRKVLKIFGVDQDQAGPPTFTFYVNRPEMVHFTYQRYLENAIRRAYGFKGSPLRLRFKGIGEQ